MPRGTPIQTSFAAGEVSPLLRGRVDLVKYQSGARSVSNFICLPQGGLMRRRGPKFISAVKDETKRTRVHAFIFSRTTRYLLEFGDLYVRIHKDDTYLGVEIATPYLEDELDTLSFSQSADVLFIAHGNHPPARLFRTSDIDWFYEVLEFEDGPYRDTNEDETIVVTATVSTDSIELEASSAIFALGDVGKLIEFKVDDVWRLGLIASYVDSTHVTIGGQDVYDRNLIIPDTIITQFNGANMDASASTFGPYMIGYYARASEDQAWRVLSSLGGNTPQSCDTDPLPYPMFSYSHPSTVVKKLDRTITGVLSTTSPLFVSTDVGRSFRLEFIGEWVWGVITAFTSSTLVTVRFETPFPRDSSDVTQISLNGATFRWRLGAWSETTGYPRVVCHHEQRMVLAGTATQPHTLWFSETDDYTSMAPTDLESTVLDTSAITYTLAAKEVNEIVWMVPGPVLLIGTIGGEWQGKAASSVSEPITPRNLVVTQQTPHGGASTSGVAVRIGSATIFLSRSGKRMYELTYSFEQDLIVSKDMTIFSEHILTRGGGGVQIAYQQDPHSLVWVLLDDGSLACCTYVRDQEVLAWHRHDISFGQVESITAMPDGLKDVLYMVARDGLNRYILKLDVEFQIQDDIDYTALTFLDAWIARSFPGSPTTTITGLTALNGRIVTVLGDGVDMGDFVVSGGSVTVPTAIEEALVGMPYTSELITLPLETGSATGTAQAKIGRIDEIGLALWQSLYFSYSDPDGSNPVEHDVFDGNFLVPAYGAEYFTGIAKYRPFNSYELEQVTRVSTRRPYPLNILAMMPENKTNE